MVPYRMIDECSNSVACAPCARHRGSSFGMSVGNTPIFKPLFRAIDPSLLLCYFSAYPKKPFKIPISRSHKQGRHHAHTDQKKR